MGNDWVAMKGVDYGMTVGVNLYYGGAMRFEVVIMSMYLHVRNIGIISTRPSALNSFPHIVPNGSN